MTNNKRIVLSSPRLLIILNRFVIGGQAVDTLPLAFFLKEDFDILIIYGEKEEDEMEATFLLDQYPGLRMQKIKWLKRSINPFVDVVAFFQILWTMVRFRPEIVHTHGAKSGLFGRLAAYLCSTPVIVHTFHGHLFHSYFSSKISSLIKALERSLSKITSGFIVLSPSQLVDLVNVFNILPLDKCRIIPLGMQLAPVGEEAENRSLFRKQYGLGDKELAIGIVGRIVPVKNHHFFIQAVQKLLKVNAGKPPAFFIIGDGELKGQVEHQLNVLSIPFSQDMITLEKRVVFTSWLSDIKQVMNGLDIIALTSLNEGTPLSIIEAQAYSKPVVATNVGGVKDTMVNNETGFYVDKSDLDGFCIKMQLLINDADLRNKMGIAGRNFVEQKFSKTREVELTKDFYISLLPNKIKDRSKKDVIQYGSL